MRPPAFWTVQEGRDAAPVLRALLTPLSWAYAAATARRIAKASPLRLAAPVISVGNLTAGGAGKTPIVRGLCYWLRDRGIDAHVISRGYGGRLAGPLQVDLQRHIAMDVGDEPCMLAKDLSVWVARDRAAGGLAALAAGAQAIVLDDGHQNPELCKDLSVVVVDAETGLGNGRVLPAGPLREPAAVGLERADAVILMGPGEPDLPAHGLPVLRGCLQSNASLRPGPKVAFCGIGRPAKFEETLQALGADVVSMAPFPDHHPYSPADLDRLQRLARAHGASLVTTEKDAARLGSALPAGAEVVQVSAAIEGDLARLMAPILAKAKDG